MKPFKNFLHVILTITSMFAFLGGWITFAHSRKPIQPVSNQTTALEPLPTLEPMFGSTSSSSNNNGFSFFAPSRPSRTSRRSMMTGGS